MKKIDWQNSTDDELMNYIVQRIEKIKKIPIKKLLKEKSPREIKV